MSTVKKNDKYISAALRYTNKVRKEVGLSPIKSLLKGVSDSESCPIANSLRYNIPEDNFLNVKVNEEEVNLEFIKGHTTLDFEDTDLPQLVQDFIERFDDVQYPHLIKK